jgi:hypothetical protein
MFCPSCHEYFEASKSRKRGLVLTQEEINDARRGMLYCFILSLVILGFCTGFGLAFEIYVLVWGGIGSALLFFAIGIYFAATVEKLREKIKQR